MKGAGTAEYTTADALDTEAIERATDRPTAPAPWYHKSYIVFGLGILGAVLLAGLVIAVVTVSEKSTQPAGTEMTPAVSPLPSPEATAPMTTAPATTAPALPSPSAAAVAPPQVAVTAETKDATPVETATPAYPVYPPFDGPLWQRFFPRWFQGQQQDGGG
jgi:hypothetical protein